MHRRAIGCARRKSLSGQRYGWQVECRDAIEIGCKHENCRVEGVPDPNSDKLRSFTIKDASL